MSSQQEMLRRTTEFNTPQQDQHEEVVYRSDGVVYNHADFSYDPNNPGIVVAQGIEKRLWPTEERLLKLFIAKPNEIIKPNELKKDDGQEASGVYVRFFVFSLRKKLEPDPKHPVVIINNQGLGYFLRDKNQLLEENKTVSPYRSVENTSDKLLGQNLKVIHPDFTYDGYDRKVVVDGQATRLTRREDDLLRVFLTYPNRMFRSSELNDMVFRDNYSDYISKLIKALRSKVERDSANPTVIINFPRAGYFLKDNGEMRIIRMEDEPQV
ncbi:MAG: hypothetical protein A3D74_03660 [Candidatus Levybacteria bacterium RIFCSPHIGHO2_02_FULL_37_13]|nr:MAG: hypothetical protein A3D74_03660 [Candidatus Levybacteria bacterium RIFCSPHIGHO2_02_FULL_37_13]OGH30648.1 MAG: hypothetical protein A3E40_04025 [Candidatus Levybacteria bacterium RIFCSPHIGHO2_12_FULL_37_9]OGH39506.1 MAG: hypothetical protein A3B41_00630 [Candidatus Levybacteria bacterium RIFCSPLOWO2_01_FULL_37_26]